MAPNQLPDPADFDAWTLAEWVEATLLLEELDGLSRTSFRERFSAGLEPDQPEIERMEAEVRRRALCAPDAYPYRVEGTRVVRPGSMDSTVYDFLLVLSLERAPYRKESRFEDINPAFELLTREALLRHLGPGAQAVRFGSPARDDRPAGFPEAVPWLARKMGLEVGSLSDVDTADNDGGLDVAAWRPFGDGQAAHVAVLAQCTVEVEYDGKANDIATNEWARWIAFGRPPMSALAIPFVVPVDAKAWMRLAGRVDLVLDRMRLVELLDSESLTAFSEYAAMQAFVESERDALLTSLASPLPEGKKRDARPKVARRRKPVRRSSTSKAKTQANK